MPINRDCLLTPGEATFEQPMVALAILNDMRHMTIPSNWPGSYTMLISHAEPSPSFPKLNGATTSGQCWKWEEKAHDRGRHCEISSPTRNRVWVQEQMISTSNALFRAYVSWSSKKPLLGILSTASHTSIKWGVPLPLRCALNADPDLGVPPQPLPHQHWPTFQDQHQKWFSPEEGYF